MHNRILASFLRQKGNFDVVIEKRQRKGLSERVEVNLERDKEKISGDETSGGWGKCKGRDYKTRGTKKRFETDSKDLIMITSTSGKEVNGK